MTPGLPAPAPVSGRAWLITIVDLVSLLVTFFLFIFALPGTAPQQWPEVLRHVAVNRGAKALPATPVPAPDQNDARASLYTQYFATVLGLAAQADPALHPLAIHTHGDRIHLVVTDDSLFIPQSGSISEGGQEVITAVTGLLRHQRTSLAVVVCAPSDSAVSADRVAALDIAMSRAETIAAALRKGGYRRPVTATAAVAASSRHVAMQLPPPPAGAPLVLTFCPRR